ncbi:MAG: helix-turn-helix domain-containing protein [Candidatus Riflebacteria bacterium]|nr:helix-turn-helix domain-containing protein [Candidatus Riflebacteria bacterium]
MTLTASQTAEKLGFTLGHVRDLLNQGVIPGFRRGKRTWGIFSEDLDRWIAERKNTNQNKLAGLAGNIGGAA